MKMSEFVSKNKGTLIALGIVLGYVAVKKVTSKIKLVSSKVTILKLDSNFIAEVGKHNTYYILKSKNESGFSIQLENGKIIKPTSMIAIVDEDKSQK